MTLRADANKIINAAIAASLPDAAVVRALKGRRFSGRVVVIAIGKAAWRMAAAAAEALEQKPYRGVVITKYKHSLGEIGDFEIIEAGHPIPDENSYYAAERAIAAVSGLAKDDTVLVLLSGGGSALFEKPLIDPRELERLNAGLLACGAGITEINTVRKRFSAVKGGRFAQLCAPAKIVCLALSDVLGDRPDSIASGPVSPDPTTAAQAREIIAKYGVSLPEGAAQLLERETPKSLPDAEFVICGSVSLLCEAAKKECERLGYLSEIVTTSLEDEARQAGQMIAEKALAQRGHGRKAFVYGGETVVKLTGHGRGGRNQELALAAAQALAGHAGVAVFSVGSDGTDGPTEAAGGYADGETAAKINAGGKTISEYLADNDSNTALTAAGALIVTGPTGTNVNDLMVALVDGLENAE